MSYELFWLDSRYSAPKGGMSKWTLNGHCANFLIAKTSGPRLGLTNTVHEWKIETFDGKSPRNIVGSVAQCVYEDCFQFFPDQ